MTLSQWVQLAGYSALACARHNIRYVGYVRNELHGKVCYQVWNVSTSRDLTMSLI